MNVENGMEALRNSNETSSTENLNIENNYLYFMDLMRSKRE